MFELFTFIHEPLSKSTTRCLVPNDYIDFDKIVSWWRSYPLMHFVIHLSHMLPLVGLLWSLSWCPNIEIGPQLKCISYNYVLTHKFIVTLWPSLAPQCGSPPSLRTSFWHLSSCFLWHLLSSFFSPNSTQPLSLIISRFSSLGLPMTSMGCQ